MKAIKTVDCYGLSFPADTDFGSLELKRFERAPNELKFVHLRNAIDTIWNEIRRRYYEERKLDYDPDIHAYFIWNEWTILMMESFCLEKEVIIAGPAASWKTTCMAMFLLCYWLSSPHNTRVILTSTTGDGLRARVWKELIHFYKPVSTVGNLIQSRTMIQTVKGDDGAGIFGIAVEADGNVEKAKNKIIGRHNPRMAVGVSEMPTVNGAIVDAGTNLETGCECFRFIGDGNPESRLDEHGKAMEPEAGWHSITAETEKWRTKRGGLGIHLDGRRSPKNRYPDKFPGLIGQVDIDATAKKYGENSLQMWQQRIGFWAPEGVAKTVLSEPMILRFNAREKAVWAGNTRLGAGLDPAFEGGDRCILRIGKVGELAHDPTRREVVTTGPAHLTPQMQNEGLWGLDPSVEIVHIKIDVTKPDDPPHYQIYRQVRAKMEEYGIPLSMLAMDTTGEGGGLAAIFTREWGVGFLEVDFGGSPTDDPVSANDPTPAKEEYDRRVTQLWFRMQSLVMNGQVRNLDDETAVEFCQRLFELKGKKIRIETKTEMKLRSKRSPDFADATVVLLELFAQRVKQLDKLVHGQQRTQENWARMVRQYDERYSDEPESQPNDFDLPQGIYA